MRFHLLRQITYESHIVDPFEVSRHHQQQPPIPASVHYSASWCAKAQSKLNETMRYLEPSGLRVSLAPCIYNMPLTDREPFYARHSYNQPSPSTAGFLGYSAK